MTNKPLSALKAPPPSPGKTASLTLRLLFLCLLYCAFVQVVLRHYTWTSLPHDAITVPLHARDPSRATVRARYEPPGTAGSDGRAGRVAICLAGKVRSFTLAAVHDTLLDNLIGPLRAAHATDVFLLLKVEDDAERGRESARTDRAATLAAVAKLSPTVVVFLNDSQDFQSAQFDTDQRGTPVLLHPPHCNFSAPHFAKVPHTHHRSAQCMRAIRERELSAGVRYAWVYRARPDVAVLDRVIMPGGLLDNRVYLNAGPYGSARATVEWWNASGSNYTVPSFGDHFMAMRRDHADIALSAVRAVGDCRFYQVPGPHNSEGMLGYWLLAHDLTIVVDYFPWVVVRTDVGPECERLRRIHAPDQAVLRNMFHRCLDYQRRHFELLENGSWRPAPQSASAGASLSQ